MPSWSHYTNLSLLPLPFSEEDTDCNTLTSGLLFLILKSIKKNIYLAEHVIKYINMKNRQQKKFPNLILKK